MLNPVERSRLSLPAWLGRWFPAIVTVISMLAVVFSMVGGWPNFTAPPGNVTATGFIVAVETERGTAGEVTEIRVQYGFAGPDGKNSFKIVTVGEGGVLPGYGWENLSNSEPIQVSYHPLQIDENIPYRAFPFWALGAWAGLVGTIAVSTALWIKIRLFPKRDEPVEDPASAR